MDETPSFAGRIPVHVALALLVSLRDVDTPNDPEALAESEMPLNLRRRLGLSSVVVGQIRRYEQRRGGAVSADEVASLFELIARRSDAAAIFREAGQRIARDDLAGRRFLSRIALRMLPHALRRRRAWSRVRRIARDLSPKSVIRVESKPSVLVIEGGLPARAAEGGVGCGVLEGVIESVFAAYREGEVQVSHRRCEGQAGSTCSWVLASTNGGGRVASGADDRSPEGREPEADETASDRGGVEDALDPITAQPESVVGG